MNWFIILSIIGFAIVIFCIGYIFGLIKNKELDKKYFEEYKKEMEEYIVEKEIENTKNNLNLLKYMDNQLKEE